MQTPTKEEEGYVQWKLEDPAINFVIETVTSGNAKQKGLSHLGIEVTDSEAFERITNKGAEAGIHGSSPAEEHCCYARSKKSWFNDPSDIKWEVFHTHERDKEYGKSNVGSACCNK